jgi:hypothetical protein
MQAIGSGETSKHKKQEPIGNFTEMRLQSAAIQQLLYRVRSKFIFHEKS